MKKIFFAVLVFSIVAGIQSYAADTSLNNIVLAPSVKKPYSYSVQQSFIQELSEMNLVSGIITEADQHILFQSKGNATFSGKSSCSYAKTKVYGMAMAGIADTVVTLRNNALFSDEITIQNNGTIVSIIKEKTPTLDLENPKILSIISGAFLGSTSLFIPLPEKEIEIGAHWKKEAEGLLGVGTGSFALKGQKSLIEYTLIGLADTLGTSCYIIDVKSKDFHIKQNIRQMNIDISIEGEGMVKGKYYIERKTGMAVLGTMKMEADLGLAVKEQESSIASMNVSYHYSCKKKD